MLPPWAQGKCGPAATLPSAWFLHRTTTRLRGGSRWTGGQGWLKGLTVWNEIKGAITCWSHTRIKARGLGTGGGGKVDSAGEAGDGSGSERAKARFIGRKRNASLSAAKTAQLSGHQQGCVCIFFLLPNNGQRQTPQRRGSGGPDVSSPSSYTKTWLNLWNELYLGPKYILHEVPYRL